MSKAKEDALVKIQSLLEDVRTLASVHQIPFISSVLINDTSISLIYTGNSLKCVGMSTMLQRTVVKNMED